MRMRMQYVSGFRTVSDFGVVKCSILSGFNGDGPVLKWTDTVSDLYRIAVKQSEKVEEPQRR